MKLNKIICGDAAEELKKMPDKCVDFVLTDPMYDFGTETKTALLAQFLRVSKNGAAVFYSPENQWMTPSQTLFWIKPLSTKNTTRRYSRFVEMIGIYGNVKWNHRRHWSQYTNVFYDLVDGEKQHPFEKPTSLIKRLILNHSDVGDIILDPFMGSGTTAVVAKILGRNFIGIEKNPVYCQIAASQLSQYAP